MAEILKKYQVVCLESLASARAMGKKKARVVMTPGLTRTLICASDAKEFLKDNPGSRVLIFSHSIDNLYQMIEVFRREIGYRYSFAVLDGYQGRRSFQFPTDFLFASFSFLDELEHYSRMYDYVIIDDIRNPLAIINRQAVKNLNNIYVERKAAFLLGLTDEQRSADGADIEEAFGDIVYDDDARFHYEVSPTPDLTRGDALEMLRNFAVALGHVPTVREMEVHTPSVYEYVNEFGSWQEALKSAGLFSIPSEDDYRLNGLKELAQELGRAPTKEEVIKSGWLSIRGYGKAFGSVGNAMRIAGLTPKACHDKWLSDEEMLELLSNLSKSLGRRPTAKDIKAGTMPMSTAYGRRFGSWRNALKLAGLAK